MFVTLSHTLSLFRPLFRSFINIYTHTHTHRNTYHEYWNVVVAVALVMVNYEQSMRQHDKDHQHYLRRFHFPNSSNACRFVRMSHVHYRLMWLSLSSTLMTCDNCSFTNFIVYRHENFGEDKHTRVRARKTHTSPRSAHIQEEYFVKCRPGKVGDVVMVIWWWAFFLFVFVFRVDWCVMVKKIVHAPVFVIYLSKK